MTDPRTITLENALKALGINPDNDPIHHARRWIEGRDSDRRERDQALTERDDATARVSARDMRIADLERDLTAKDAALKTAHAALKRICEVIGASVPCVAEDAVEAVTRIHDAYARVNTTLNDLSDFMRAVAPDTLPPWTGADVVRAVESVHARADRAEATLAEMVKALSDHGAPRYYDDPSTPTKRGAQLSPVERLRVTLSVHHWKASAAERRAHEAEESREALLQERRLARDALLGMGAPCRADGFDLDLAARIRAIPR